MANLTSYRRVTGDIAEAERIARLLREEFAQDFKDGKFTTDVTAFKTLNERTALVAKWDAIVEDLKNATAAPSTATTDTEGGDRPATGAGRKTTPKP